MPPPTDVILTAEAMREADRRTIEDFGLPSLTLMESAGRAATDAMEAHLGPLAGKSVVCFCGKGNNGGDGFVVARVLHARGARLRVVTLTDEEAMSEDAAHHFRLLRRLATHADDDGEDDDNGRLRLDRLDDDTDLGRYRDADVLVDALLGTGLTSDVRPPVRRLVQWMNDTPRPTVALDLPTGLHADTGAVLGAAVRADLTVTMAAYKAGLLLGEGPTHAGAVSVVEIGIPAFVIESVGTAAGCARLTTDAAVRGWLPVRPASAHKYSVGMTLVVGGSADFLGAPFMAATAAARVGSGYVVCACPEDIAGRLAAKFTEIATLALPTDADGLRPEGARDALAPRLGKAAALLLGPGLGRATGTQAFVRALLADADPPLVLDADGLNALIGHTDLLATHADGRWVLTPHFGEFKRLASPGVDADADADVEDEDRIRLAQAYAARWNSVLVLKGMPSVVAAPDGRAFVCGTGNPALATAGTGDVLAGLCAGLLAQGLAPLEAAAAACHLGGAAADRYAAHAAPQSLMAMDLLTELPALLHQCLTP